MVRRLIREEVSNNFETFGYANRLSEGIEKIVMRFTRSTKNEMCILFLLALLAVDRYDRVMNGEPQYSRDNGSNIGKQNNGNELCLSQSRQEHPHLFIIMKQSPLLFLFM
jgi:hypothetical protein